MQLETKGSKTMRGQMLVEAMVAISILIIAVFSIFTLIARSISLNRVIADQYVGTYLASEGVEIVKNIIDTNLLPSNCNIWKAGLSQDGDYEVSYKTAGLLPFTGKPLRYDATTGLYDYVSASVTKYYRTIRLSLVDRATFGDELKVNSIVSWTTRGGAQGSVNLEDHLFNWKLPPASCFP